MEYAIVAVPAAPVRRKPGHSKEMVNQLLFGESVRVLKSKGELWVKTKSLHDGYIGWMTNTMLQAVDDNQANTTCSFVTKELLTTLLIGQKEMHIPVGSSLPFFENHEGDILGGKGKLGQSTFSFNSQVLKKNNQSYSEELIIQLTMRWLNAPYLWGGRTPLGVDCSGFVQVVFKMLGIDMPRDAWQQAKAGKTVKKFSDLKIGDLAFFEKKKNVVHVGIIINDNQIIHSSGKVRIDTLTETGIMNNETGKEMFRLKVIRRVW